MIEKFLDALDEGKEYDFIARNYHQMNISSLKDILLEYIYAVHQCEQESREYLEDFIRDNLIDRGIHW